MAIFKGSRYAGCYVFSDVHQPDIVYLDPIRDRKFEPEVADLMIQVEEGDRLDIIANRLYQDPQLGWVILDNNPQYMSELDIKVGDVIRCPLPEKVRVVNK